MDAAGRLIGSLPLFVVDAVQRLVIDHQLGAHPQRSHARVRPVRPVSSGPLVPALQERTVQDIRHLRRADDGRLLAPLNSLQVAIESALPSLLHLGPIQEVPHFRRVGLLQVDLPVVHHELLQAALAVLAIDALRREAHQEDAARPQGCVVNVGACAVANDPFLVLELVPASLRGEDVVAPGSSEKRHRLPLLDLQQVLRSAASPPGLLRAPIQEETSIRRPVGLSAVDDELQMPPLDIAGVHHVPPEAHQLQRAQGRRHGAEAQQPCAFQLHPLLAVPLEPAPSQRG
mmetsp:Transcript_25433/g.60623  ORF Transcript_25433/g.60623 Transcript_25433/m.60623 type:complete len:288 (-) Transcript_25433:736-1599(-)